MINSLFALFARVLTADAFSVIFAGDHGYWALLNAHPLIEKESRLASQALREATARATLWVTVDALKYFHIVVLTFWASISALSRRSM